MSEELKNKHPVLIIEDDFSIRETFTQALELEGYLVVTAENGAEGIDKLRTMPVSPCLVIMDMVMPVMDGRQFLDAVLADPKISNTPLVVVSATASVATTQGARAFLRKPVDLNVLLDIVEKHCIKN
jgi:two-component system chemotaxis response regulator CheY